ncbi:MAG: DUF3500 domain-containing protein [Verrucomicrobiales bacterium]|nr:DUF3500 domain-containing protein [Verrucomicrobiales bacterium]
MKRFIPIFFCLALMGGSVANGHEAATEMADAAKVWLQNLSGEQKAQATFDLTDEERENWHFIPKPFEGEGMRGGLTLKDMRPDQRHLAYALLSTGLSHRGYLTATQIMSLEHVLWELEQAPKRDTLMYYVSIFGEPGSKAWGWRFEGHHMSLNFTIADGKVTSATPNFFASNPGEILEGPRKGLRVLAAEEDVARSLVQSLSDEQKGKALVEEKAPRDILTSAEPTVQSLGEAGISHADLDGKQRKLLRQLIHVYIKRTRPEVARDELAAMEAAGMDKVVFAWAGGINKGDPHYYRVQGPDFLLEYANTQNNANHVHAVWRDFDGDFGRDVLKEHYQAHHKAE